MVNKILLILSFCFIFNACANYFVKDSIDVIIVSKTPRGDFAGEDMPDALKNLGWHDIGLSINGKEPIEYIWRISNGPFDYTIMNAEIGDIGNIRLSDGIKIRLCKLPKPNSKEPPIIGSRDGIRWNRKE